MMGGVVRLEALRALAALIEAQIPELAGHVCDSTPPSSEFEELPNLAIETTRWGFDPEQASEHATLPGNVVVYDVGDHSCALVLSIVAATPGQRADLEAKVIDLFLSSEHPSGYPLVGVVCIPVTACPALSMFYASFELESDEWNNTLALDRRYESRIVVNAIIPALTIKTPVYTINSLRLAFVEDPTAIANPSAIEVFTINEDGSITR